MMVSTTQKNRGENGSFKHWLPEISAMLKVDDIIHNVHKSDEDSSDKHMHHNNSEPMNVALTPTTVDGILDKLPNTMEQYEL